MTNKLSAVFENLPAAPLSTLDPKDAQGLHMDEFLVLFKIGDVVELLPEYQDPGDSEFEWVVVEAEDRGRLVISPFGTGLKVVPKYRVERAWVRRSGPSNYTSLRH
jgi:hypothetical protein